MKPLTIFRVFLVAGTAVFMSFHTQIFIARIEPNLIFSWAAALIIEGFLISLALQKTIVSRVLLVPLFLISVVSASASFVVQNEQLLNLFITQKRIIQQLQNDLTSTKRAYEFGQKYTTKTLQRERQLQDELRQILTRQNGDLTLVNAFVFLILVLVMQSVSIYTAMSVKRSVTTRNSETRIGDTGETRSVSQGETAKHLQGETAKQEQSDTHETLTVSPGETETVTPTKTAKQSDTETQILRLRDEGKSIRAIAEELQISTRQVNKVLQRR
jgi:hypothetical protein